MDKYFGPLLLIVILQVTPAVGQNFIVVNGTHDISNVLQSSNYDYIDQYKLLHVLDNIYCNISQCYGSTLDTSNYHRHCFASQCPYQQYHCLSVSGKIIHFCAKFDDCKLRSKDIAVFNEQEPDLVDVYNVSCEYGYFQPNDHHNCFQPCAKDTSIAIAHTSGHNTHAYCLPEHGCNPFGKLLFELGTKYDGCTGTNQCSTSQDLLPDCSCVENCPQNHVRLPENMFNCSPRVEQVIISTSDTKESGMPTLTVPDGRRDNDITHEPQDDQTDSTGLEKRFNTVENSSGPIVSTEAIVITACVCVVLLVIVALAGCVLWKLNRAERRELGNQSGAERREVGNQSGAERREVGNQSGVKQPEAENKAETIVTNISAINVNICKRDNFNITVNRSEPDADSARSDSECQLSLDDEQKMKLLKDPDVDYLAQTNVTQEDASLTFPKQEYFDIRIERSK